MRYTITQEENFFAFQDILEKGEKSKYLDWYFIDELPPRGEWGEIPNFKCFGYYGGMPKLNLKNPEVEKYITDVACYWIKECDIDGWRLDVGDEISHFFWKNFRKAIKAVKKDMLIIGEIWHYAGDFLEGDEWDTVMNYPFYLNLIDLLADEKINVSQFVQNLGYLKGRLNKKCYPLMWNLIDSHDTARFLHLCHDNKKKQHLAAAFQLLLPECLWSTMVMSMQCREQMIRTADEACTGMRNTRTRRCIIGIRSSCRLEKHMQCM